MNTVGRKGKLGEQIRCIVSVSMLTEGWDANTVTHVLGCRAFGTQLLCEQVVGRALRRVSYDADGPGLLLANCEVLADSFESDDGRGLFAAVGQWHVSLKSSWHKPNEQGGWLLAHSQVVAGIWLRTRDRSDPCSET